jgi:hypothetical protein
MVKRHILFLYLIILALDINSQNINNNKILKGTDTYLSYDCKDSCMIIYKDFTIITKRHLDSPGEDIFVLNNKSKEKTIVDVKNAYKAQNFLGLIKNKLLIDAGTYIIREFYIYDLKTQKIIFKNSYNKELKIINNKITYIYVYSGSDKPKQLPSVAQKKEIEKIGVDYGIVEDRIYDILTNKVITTSKPKYSTY